MISIHTCIYIIYIYISFSLIIVHIVLLFTISMIIVGDLKHQQWLLLALHHYFSWTYYHAPKQCFQGKTCYLNDDNEYTEMLAWLISCCSPQRSKKSICLGLKTRSHWNHHPLVGSHVDVHYETPGIVLSEQWVRSTTWGGKRNQSCELV